MNANLDKSAEVRSGEELDVVRLTEYLRAQGEAVDGSVEVRQFPRGYSNLTYLLKYGQQEYVLRRPPHGANIKSAHDMGREYRVLSTLKPVYSRVPRAVSYCDNPSVLGAPFYLMERVQGVILRDRLPRGVILSEAQLKATSEAAIDNLAALHALDVEATGLIDLGKPEGYVGRQVAGWIKRYDRAQTETIEAMDQAADWMMSNQPGDSPPAFIHNDYKYDNLVLDPDNLAEIVAVLDWEMATVGDPLMDLGTTLAYWTEADDEEVMRLFGITWQPGNLSRAELAHRYAQQTNQRVEDFLFYYVFGCFKVAVIAQQIYARYQQGLTKDPRFAVLIQAVRACAKQARRAIQRGSISH